MKPNLDLKKIGNACTDTQSATLPTAAKPASSMAAVRPSPSVMRGAPVDALRPKSGRLGTAGVFVFAIDRRFGAPTQSLDSRATGVFEGLASLAPRVRRRPSRAEGAMGAANERRVGASGT